MKIFLSLFVLFAVTGTGFSQAIDGDWTGSVIGPEGEFPIAFTFMAEGSTLTGSTTGFDGTQVPIEDGQIDGENLSFSVTMDFGGMPFTLSYSGIVAQDEIMVTGDAFGMPFEFVLTRAE